MNRKPLLPTGTVILAVIVASQALAAETSPPAGYAFRLAAEAEAGSSELVAENTAQGFRTRVSQEGVRVTPLAGDWNLGLSLVRIGRGDDLEPVGPAGATIDGHRTELDRRALVEWYINDECGLEQGFTFSHRPAGDEDAELVLELDLSGNLLAMVDEDRRGVRLLRPGKPLAVLSYRGLLAYDAEGSELPARMEITGDGGLLIRVMDTGAVYPVTVDPLLTTSSWSSVDTDNTRSIAWGDWDGDGDLDLAAGNFGANRVYENTGGALASWWTSTDTDNTFSVAWGDWDGDGDLDLAAGNYGQANRVYENDGLGFSTSLTSVWTSVDTDDTVSVAWGDRDGDGDLELAAGNANQANRVYKNSGGALSSNWTSVDIDSTWSVAWGDWDGDGDLDLAAGNDGQANRVYENVGFGLASAWTSADTDSTYSVAWGDRDGDGDLDLAAGNHGQANRVYDNDGLGQSTSLTSIWTSIDTDNTRGVAWGDWDGDGDLDLAAGNYSQASRVYENTGGALASVWTSTDTDQTLGLAWGDWDGDGDLDLAVGNVGANRTYGNTGGALTSVWASTEEYNSTRTVAWGDWDGDGDLDLAAGSVGNVDRSRVYENSGGNLISAWTAAEGGQTRSLAWGDWDGDGDLDLAVGYWEEANRVYENTGGALSSVWTSPDIDGTYSVAWGDWDGDGDLDLAAGNSGAPNRVYENDGLGLSTSLISVWTSVDIVGTYSVAWGDWDGDGDLDLAAGNWGYANRVYENTGGALSSVWTSADTDYTHSVAWGDFDGDGDLDLAAGNFIDEANRVYENDGLGLPSSLTSVWTSADTASYTTSVAWGDWDGDGDLDLAAGNWTDVNRVYENTGGALASAWTSTDTDATISVAWGDWDGDGDLDLAAGNQQRDGNRLYENGVVRQQEMLPETPVTPALPTRPGVTDAGFFFSSAECVYSPVTVEYILTDAQSDSARSIVPEYSVVGGGSWQPATEGPGSDGTEELEADEHGWGHVFIWDALTDGVKWADHVVFRISVPYQASTHAAGPIQRAAMSAVSPPFRICSSSDVSVTKDDGVSDVTLGQELTYTIVVSNAGPGDAQGVRVTDDFPAALTGVSWTCSEGGGGTCGTASGSGDIDETVDLPVGTHVTFTAIATVTQFGATGMTNIVLVEVPPSVDDPSPSNNTAGDFNWGWLPPEIFADGFEAGNTASWSSTVP
jgi:uncharacterized repeat protein (TIGR01451 family)